MSALKELLSEARKRRVANVGTKAEKDEAMGGRTNNFVAKNSQNMTGAGAHEDKNGKKASRNRQKRDWKKEAKSEY